MSQPKQAINLPVGKPAKPDFLNDWTLRQEETDETAQTGGWRKAALAAAIFGLLFAVLYFLAYYLLSRTPLGNASDADIVAYYGQGNNLTLTLAGMLFMPFAGIAFLYFMTFLRAAARATGIRFSRVLTNIQFATGVIFVAMLFVATAGLVATPASMQFAGMQTDPLAARILPLFSVTVLLGFGMRMASMFVISSTSIGKATGIIPGWFAWLGYIAGVLLLLSFTFATWFAALFAVWVIVLCIILLLKR